MELRWLRYKKYSLLKINPKLRRLKSKKLKLQFNCRNSKNIIKTLMLKVELAVTTARKKRMMMVKVAKRSGANNNDFLIDLS
jgi:hypothetical protein